MTAVTTDPRQTSARGTAVVGGSDPRIDVHAKATGQTMYADDIHLPRMLVGRLLRSPYRHAKILRVDVTQAAALPGVHGILTGRDLPICYGIMPVAQDEHALALHKVRYHGEPVAAVAAINEAEVEMGLPANITGKFAGTAEAYQASLRNQPILIATALLAVYIGGALALFGLRASTVTEGERFAPVSREGALVFNNLFLQHSGHNLSVTFVHGNQSFGGFAALWLIANCPSEFGIENRRQL